MVHEITDNIHDLDIAKTNLTSTIRALTQLNNIGIVFWIAVNNIISIFCCYLIRKYYIVIWLLILCFYLIANITLVTRMDQVKEMVSTRQYKDVASSIQVCNLSITIRDIISISKFKSVCVCGGGGV
jgi:hypothetical protein